EGVGRRGAGGVPADVEPRGAGAAGDDAGPAGALEAGAVDAGPEEVVRGVEPETDAVEADAVEPCAGAECAGADGAESGADGSATAGDAAAPPFRGADAAIPPDAPLGRGACPAGRVATAAGELAAGELAAVAVAVAAGIDSAPDPAGAGPSDPGAAPSAPSPVVPPSRGEPARRAPTRSSKPEPVTMPARRSVAGWTAGGLPLSSPTLMRRTGSRTISSTQVKARAPERARGPSAPWTRAQTLPRSRMTVPSSVGATTPKAGGSAPPPKTTPANRRAMAAPGCSPPASASTASRISSAESVSARYTTAVPNRATSPAPGAMPTVDGVLATRQPPFPRLNAVQDSEFRGTGPPGGADPWWRCAFVAFRTDHPGKIRPCSVFRGSAIAFAYRCFGVVDIAAGSP